MAFEPSGSMIWSDQPAQAINPVQTQMLQIAGVGSIAAGALYYGARSGNANWNPLDSVIEATALVGDMSPFGVANTFRAPDFFSPFGSPKSQGLGQNISGLSQGSFGFQWDKEFLTSHSTQAYLKTAFGLSSDDLASAGILPGMEGNEASVATDLIFERKANNPNGKLYTLVDGQRRELASNVSLMNFTRDRKDLLDSKSGVSRAAQGVFQALDMWQHDDFSPYKVFHTKQGDDYVPARNLPIPSSTGSVGSLGDLWRRSTLARAVPAFEIDRFNRLAENFLDATFGEGGSSAVKAITGIGVKTMPGPASQTFFRIGGKAAALGAVGIGISQSDWFRRNYGTAGEVAASGGVSAGLAYATSRLTGSPKTAMMVGVASFFGQMVLPGFEEGLVPGLATTYTRTQTLRANEFNPVNYYRRSLEGFAPGITSWETGAILGS